MNVYDRLVRSHANLRARGYITAAEDMNAALALLDQYAKERDHALAKAQDADQLRARIDRLQYDLMRMRQERDHALDKAKAADELRARISRLEYDLTRTRQDKEAALEEARVAAMPLAEARAVARSEVRAVLKPFLTDGVQGTRMLAQTIKASLDAEWGKEPQ